MILKIKFFQIYLFFLAATLFFSCKTDSRPDVSNIKADIKIERFDRDLYAGKKKPLSQVTSELEKKYGYFYNDYVNYIIGNGAYSGKEMIGLLYQDKAYDDLTAETDSVYPDLKKYEEALSESFRYIKYYQPKAKIPRFISFISGFSYQNTVGEDYVSIGLDMFLGKNSQFYGAIVQSAPRYISRRFTPEYLVPRTVETYIREELYPEPEALHNLLEKMIYNGKILYYMDQVLPENVPDSIKIGYTDRQLGWCKTYEKEIWGYFLQNNFLYESEMSRIQVFLAEGPFTPGVGVNHESAPKLGIWTGWQIVRKYMQANPEVTLQQLMSEKDMQRILNKSRYKP